MSEDLDAGQRVVAEALVSVEGYKDLEDPVILTSGELGIYYINTEKLAQDGGRWADFAEDSRGMIRHCVAQADQHDSFREVIRHLAEVASGCFPEDVPRHKRFISGGQRRDWLFSGPVAHLLGYPHISLHKDGSAFLLGADLEQIESIEGEQALEGSYVVHIVDLLTKGSSAYNPELNPPTGWIVTLRELGATVNELITVVSRLQGGEEILRSVEVVVKSFVKINPDFIREHSSQSETALAYMEDPYAWSENYIVSNGIEPFIAAFDPNGGKLVRAEKFLKVYADVLRRSNLLELLRERVKEQYGTDLSG